MSIMASPHRCPSCGASIDIGALQVAHLQRSVGYMQGSVLGQVPPVEATRPNQGPVESAQVVPDKNALLRRALQDAEAGLVFAGADVEPAGDFVPTPTLALRAVRAALAVEPVKPQEPAALPPGFDRASLMDLADWLAQHDKTINPTPPRAGTMTSLAYAAALAVKPQEKQGEPFTDENCGERITAMLMECVERLGNFPRADVDARAWRHLLVYAPKEKHGEPPDEQLQAAFERSSGGPNPYFRCKTCGMTEPGIRTCLAEHFKKCNAITVPGTNQPTSRE